MRLAPGGPFDEEQAIPPEIEANLQAAYGLDQPIIVQYGRYLGGLARGDLGPSFKYKDYSVAELIGRGLPVTAHHRRARPDRGSAAGRTARLAAALRHDGPVDHAVMTVSPWPASRFPVSCSRRCSRSSSASSSAGCRSAGWEAGSVRHMVLPVITLALPFVAYIARLTRGSLLEVLQAPYLRAARAKGLASRCAAAPACTQADAAAGRELSRAGRGGAADGLAGGGAGVRLARRRALLRAGRDQP